MPSPRTAAMGLIVFCAAHEKNVYSLLRSMISFCAVGAVITCLKYSVSQNKESKGASPMRSYLQYRRVSVTLQELALSVVAQPLWTIHDLCATQEDCRCAASHLSTLEQVVINIHMVRLGADNFFAFRVPYHHIGI